MTKVKAILSVVLASWAARGLVVLSNHGRLISSARAGCVKSRLTIVDILGGQRWNLEDD